VVLVVPDQDPAVCVRALQLGAEDVVFTGATVEEKVARVERALRSRARVERLLEEGAALRQLAVTDGLTGVHNHRYFQERLADEFRRAQRFGDPLSLVLVDLDHFKDVNDRFGHMVGDAVLREVAGLFQKVLRDTDLLARYGGEEFAVLLPRTDPAGAFVVAERIWSELDALRLESSDSVHVTASLGLASHPFPAFASARELLRAADRALYRAKRQGRNQICAEMDAASHLPAAAASDA
jgi:diguanylate cyclase (GGDEF)-like protein